ncbi:uncharacterized protein LOC111350043 isoform X2 [Spodoptera litura]|uniref:Uncharacterized protein LOC111350043 isoform X2 n=1 Tax=Spodoptera litura TaxID=69820 RepID=A0A9J7DTX4_SPOLT|nr:uncharacterized protein LOC111350043 isoform X2 [Spodoptera litura]
MALAKSNLETALGCNNSKESDENWSTIEGSKPSNENQKENVDDEVSEMCESCNEELPPKRGKNAPKVDADPLILPPKNKIRKINDAFDDYVKKLDYNILCLNFMKLHNFIDTDEMKVLYLPFFYHVKAYQEFFIMVIDNMELLESQSLDDYKYRNVCDKVMQAMMLKKADFKLAHTYKYIEHIKNLILTVEKQYFGTANETPVLSKSNSETELSASATMSTESQRSTPSDHVSNGFKTHCLRVTLAFIQNAATKSKIFPELSDEQIEYLHSLVGNEEIRDSDQDIQILYKNLCNGLRIFYTNYDLKMQTIESGNEKRSLLMEKVEKPKPPETTVISQQSDINISTNMNPPLPETSNNEVQDDASKSTKTKKNQMHISSTFAKQALTNILEFLADDKTTTVFSPNDSAEFWFYKRCIKWKNPDIRVDWTQETRQLYKKLKDVQNVYRVVASMKKNKKKKGSTDPKIKFHQVVYNKILIAVNPGGSEGKKKNKIKLKDLININGVTENIPADVVNKRNNTVSEDSETDTESSSLTSSVEKKTVRGKPKKVNEKIDWRGIELERKGKLREGLANPVQSDKAMRMMRGMGWSGGALGARGNGIMEPITLEIDQPKCVGFGHKKREKAKQEALQTKKPFPKSTQDWINSDEQADTQPLDTDVIVEKTKKLLQENISFDVIINEDFKVPKVPEKVAQSSKTSEDEDRSSEMLTNESQSGSKMSVNELESTEMLKNESQGSVSTKYEPQISKSLINEPASSEMSQNKPLTSKTPAIEPQNLKPLTNNPQTSSKAENNPQIFTPSKDHPQCSKSLQNQSATLKTPPNEPKASKTPQIEPQTSKSPQNKLQSPKDQRQNATTKKTITYNSSLQTIDDQNKEKSPLTEPLTSRKVLTSPRNIRDDFLQAMLDIFTKNLQMKTLQYFKNFITKEKNFVRHALEYLNLDKPRYFFPEERSIVKKILDEYRKRPTIVVKAMLSDSKKELSLRPVPLKLLPINQLTNEENINIYIHTLLPIFSTQREFYMLKLKLSTLISLKDFVTSQNEELEIDFTKVLNKKQVTFIERAVESINLRVKNGSCPAEVRIFNEILNSLKDNNMLYVGVMFEHSYRSLTFSKYYHNIAPNRNKTKEKSQTIISLDSTSDSSSSPPYRKPSRPIITEADITDDDASSLSEDINLPKLTTPPGRQRVNLKEYAKMYNKSNEKENTSIAEKIVSIMEGKETDYEGKIGDKKGNFDLSGKKPVNRTNYVNENCDTPVEYVVCVDYQETVIDVDKSEVKNTNNGNGAATIKTNTEKDTTVGLGDQNVSVNNHSSNVNEDNEKRLMKYFRFGPIVNGAEPNNMVETDCDMPKINLDLSENICDKNTKSFEETVKLRSGMKVAYILHVNDPIEKIDLEKAKEIQRVISENIIKGTHLPLLKCHGYQDDSFIYSCQNQESFEWLERIIHSIGDLKIFTKTHTKMLLALRSFYDFSSDVLFKMLELYNEGLSTKYWEVECKRSKDDMIIIVVKMDESSIDFICDSNMALYAGVDKIEFSLV